MAVSDELEQARFLENEAEDYDDPALRLQALQVAALYRIASALDAIETVLLQRDG